MREREFESERETERWRDLYRNKLREIEIEREVVATPADVAASSSGDIVVVVATANGFTFP